MVLIVRSMKFTRSKFMNLSRVQILIEACHTKLYYSLNIVKISQLLRNNYDLRTKRWIVLLKVFEPLQLSFKPSNQSGFLPCLKYFKHIFKSISHIITFDIEIMLMIYDHMQANVTLNWQICWSVVCLFLLWTMPH